MNHPRLVARLVLAAVATSALLVAPTTTQAAFSADNPYQRGPAPTEQSISSTRGPYAVSKVSISELADLAVRQRHDLLPHQHLRRQVRCRLHLARLHRLRVLDRLARPAARILRIRRRHVQHQLGLRLSRLTRHPAPRGPGLRDHQLPGRLAHRRSRQAVVGHSMGGGGTLEAAKTRRRLEAAVPLTPLEPDKSWPEVEAATLVIGAQSDTVAPVASTRSRSTTHLSNAERAAYLELSGCQHLRAQHRQRHDRELHGGLAQALRRQRHPLRPVHLARPDPVSVRRCVRLPSEVTRTPGPRPGRGPGAPANEETAHECR